ncbi:hypothetical protein BDK51DRAFT_39154 [Blyttiomyces helicus]|uniref:Quinon protein alcohol dehydrogenase-like superfamily n=1 Tax=Blyttiomyces helicus TaxID=388810 RepID=A0A4P9WD69_9FUNG|nr:hypothetical protein BDK51DRAFT_39154 [Blyttiomyces helicus]|eukprot:RKO90621.1 hypothetical protein BDK51DRAFT_39154 [Blyttiomyces helicus]
MDPSPSLSVMRLGARTSRSEPAVTLNGSTSIDRVPACGDAKHPYGGRFLYVPMRRIGLACLEAATGKMLWRDPIPCMRPEAVLSPCGRVLILVWGRWIEWRRVGTEGLSKRVELLTGHPALITALSLSPDGKTLCSGDILGTVVHCFPGKSQKASDVSPTASSLPVVVFGKQLEDLASTKRRERNAAAELES